VFTPLHQKISFLYPSHNWAFKVPSSKFIDMEAIMVSLVVCLNPLHMISCYLLFAGKVTFQEFRKLPTAAMDDYMNKLKESSPIHRERSSNQTWLHQGTFADKVMQRLRVRWVSKSSAGLERVLYCPFRLTSELNLSFVSSVALWFPYANIID